MLLAVQGIILGLVVAVARFVPTLRMQLRKATFPLLVANAAFGVGLWMLRLTFSQIPIPFG